ncbi:MAG TPA: protein kinase, partial [bacterium]|nr:protein kinase [bacterium]
MEGSRGPCALKLLKGNLVSLKKGALDEFRHEFEILKDMRHPNIAGILDFGFDADEGRYYYTSEFIEGVDFNKATEGMEVEKVTGLVVEALRALEYLHSYRIHHFDIKAANVLVV